MKFYSIRDLRTESKNLWEQLAANEEVVITNNGKPAALMIEIDEEHFEEVLRAVRSAKAMVAINAIRATARSNGYMTEEEIEAEIQAARDERTARTTSASRVAEDITYARRP